MQRMNSSFRHTRSEYQRVTVRGFTLVELMVTLIVLGIVMAIAIPSFRDMMASSRVTSNANEIVAGLQEARMEAVRRRARVVVCPSVNGGTCAGTNWGHFITFVDLDNNNQTGAADETVVRDSLLEINDLTLAGSPAVASDARIWFSADGLASVGAAASPKRSASIRICSSKLADPNSRDISISISRVAVTPAHSAACAAPADPAQ